MSDTLNHLPLLPVQPARPVRTLADIDNAVIADLRAERDIYRNTLRKYANRHHWARNPASEENTCDVFLLTCDGYTPAEDALAQFATTAPSG